MDSKGRVVIKLGGGLITDKSISKTINMSAIDKVCKVILEIQNEGYNIIIVHGAGSYGHILAKEMDIANGIDKNNRHGQRNAVKKIRKDMLELNSHVIESLENLNLNVEVHPPSKWAKGIGMNFKGDITIFEKKPKGVIPMCFGDVVDREDDFEFGILSGDDLMYRLSVEIPDVKYTIFLLGDVGGVMDLPPTNPDAKILEIWSKTNFVKTKHNSDIDVTGGIDLKLDRAARISKHVSEVWFLDGRNPNRIIELIRDGETIGTKIIP
ncbi:MAG: hypothetical protein HOJ64_05690 [Euryarchaeota archaeon]|nr:hypothetical protein [Euryarchaeota archaeon]MBT6873839.1 hypothetical protein [Euryarchaeota archaeon]